MFSIKSIKKDSSSQPASTEQISEMLEAGAHFGFAKARRHPSILSFVLGRKNNVEIFNLEKVGVKLNEAKEFVSSIASLNQQVLFVGGKKESQRIIKDTAEKIEMPYVSGRWIGGTLTNFPEIRKRVDRLLSLIEQKEKGLLGKYTKKERLLLEREVAKLEEKFGGIVSMSKKPGAVFIIDADKEHIARDEAIKEGIPVISICSSDCNISNIDYPIPANDSAVKSIQYFTNQIADAYAEGKKSAPEKTEASKDQKRR